VNQQAINFALQRPAGLTCLPFRLRQADDNITEHLWLYVRETTFAVRKGKNIRRSINMPPPPVDSPHQPVADEQDAQFRVTDAGSPQQESEPVP
jgi:hypothetical protein